MGLTTFSTGLSGLASNSQGLNVTGNNLANLNTVGFKASTINFNEVLGQSFAAPSGGTMHIGLGAQVGSIRPLFTQGGPQTTNNPLDAMIQGKGFFVLDAGNGNFYTRAGGFRWDANGLLVGTNDLPVLGFAKDPVTGRIDTSKVPSSIRNPGGLSNPQPTSIIELAMNLNAAALNGDTYSTSFNIYDSLGTEHRATLSLQKSITGGATPVTSWSFDLTVPNNEVAGVASTNTQNFSLITGAVATTPPAAGTLLFDSKGSLQSAWIGAAPGTPPPLADLMLPDTGVTLPRLTNGASFSVPGIQFKLVGASGGSNITAYGAESTVTSTYQNGISAGSPSALTIQADGTVTLAFTSGQTQDIGRLALSVFNSPEGLVPRGSGLYSEHTNSGSPSIGAPGEGGRGRLLGGVLENSNVDLATELTNIITFQRGYQASARIITVTDQVLQETINLRQ